MNRGLGRIALAIVTLFTPASLVGLANPASAGLIATDSYTIGPGGYSAGTAASPTPLHLQTSTLATSVGFAAGSIYNGGSGTSNFDVYQAGMAATDASNAGHIAYSGYAGDNNVRSVARSLASPVVSSGTYWFNITVSQDGTSTPSTLPGVTNGYTLAGFSNTTPPTLGATTSNGMASGANSYLQGLYFGFAHEPNSTDATDLVIRYRNTIGYTAGDTILVNNPVANAAYNIIAELQVNVGGGSADLLSYFVNPGDTSSVAALESSTNASLTNYTSPATTYAFQTPADFARLTYSAQGWNGDATSASFGDPTLGTTLADVAPQSVPEPASLMMLSLGLAGVLVVGMRRRAIA